MPKKKPAMPRWRNPDIADALARLKAEHRIVLVHKPEALYFQGRVSVDKALWVRDHTPELRKLSLRLRLASALTN